MKIYSSFDMALSMLTRQMEHQSTTIHTAKWQSIDISKMPAAAMQEMINVTFGVPMHSEDPKDYVEGIKPNLPWADQHFERERVSGSPLNPGTTWRDWPWASSADKFRKEGDQFSHTYAERFWPKRAGQTTGGHIKDVNFDRTKNHGIRFPYGDLTDLVKLLGREPYTRQAYLPIWFPEDTGVVHGERVPCTLGYHFLMRDNALNVFYPIRSCDFYRHLRDDLYLTVRLTLEVLRQARGFNPEVWDNVRPGLLTFWAGSLHMFIGDYQKLFKHNPLAPSRVSRG